jgi:NAD(P)-dependent dehydrogenase (short-subunit alcohol dehydrogenase family)
VTSPPCGLLAGKVILVIGAGRGIGAAAARLFAGEGAAVMLAARTAAELDATVSAVTAAGGAAVRAVADVRDDAALAAAVRQTVTAFGRLDGAFNNAGIALPPAGLTDLGEDGFDAMTAVNFKAVWRAMRHEIAVMRDSGRPGAIVNTSSVGSLYGNAGRSAYSAVKAAVNSLTATAAVECGPYGIRVNAIAPGTTMTPLVRSWSERDPGVVARMTERTPLGRAAEPPEIAEAAAWLLSDRASYVTGVVLRVDGGLHA